MELIQSQLLVLTCRVWSYQMKGTYQECNFFKVLKTYEEVVSFKDDFYALIHLPSPHKNCESAVYYPFLKEDMRFRQRTEDGAAQVSATSSGLNSNDKGGPATTEKSWDYFKVWAVCLRHLHLLMFRLRALGEAVELLNLLQRLTSLIICRFATRIWLTLRTYLYADISLDS